MFDFVLDLMRENYFLFTLVVFIFGACVGSFLNVCILRMPDDEKSIWNPKYSCCPKCSKRLAWYDNIPILGYMVLAGKCRYCKAKISVQYVIVEVLTGWVFVQYLNVFGLTPEYVFYLYLTCSLFVATIIDFRFQIIPDEINFAGIIFGLVLSFSFPLLHGVSDHAAGLGHSVLGLFAGGGSIYLIGILGDFIFKKESMGGGDIKLMAMIGVFLGWKMTLLTFFLAPFFGAVLGIYAKYVKKESIIPYGPFLSLAALLALFAGDKIMWYLWRI